MLRPLVFKIVTITKKVYFCALFFSDMKKFFCVFLLAAGLLLNGLFAQAPTKLQVSLLNNHFNHVNLTSAYGSSQTSYASADIKNDKFDMTVNLANDIYRLDFGNGSSMLLVITPGETVTMTLDAENLQQMSLTKALS